MTLCIIPARGGSKRIPRKNIKLFNGKPMIAHSIQAAQNSGCFEQIIVSTDDAEIADISQQYGATVPFTRPAELSDVLHTVQARLSPMSLILCRKTAGKATARVVCTRLHHLCKPMIYNAVCLLCAIIRRNLRLV
nr:NTP transferase domain-containing protein [Kingella kingae]